MGFSGDFLGFVGISGGLWGLVYFELGFRGYFVGFIVF